MLFIDIRNLDDPNTSTVAPVTYGQMISEFTDRSIPVYPLTQRAKIEELVKGLGFAICEPIKLSTAKAHIPDTFKGKEMRVSGAEKVDGVWHRLYSVYDILPSRLHLLVSELKSNRNKLLEASDYIMLPDIWETLTPEKRIEWAEYRQSLRDLPEKYDHPVWAKWPERPE
jgi:hypothetical protein